MGMTAACLGMTCPKRGTCVHYSAVEQDHPRLVSTCRTPEGTFPLFEPVEPRRRTDGEVAVDGEGDTCD